MSFRRQPASSFPDLLLCSFSTAQSMQTRIWIYTFNTTAPEISPYGWRVLATCSYHWKTKIFRRYRCHLTKVLIFDPTDITFDNEYCDGVIILNFTKGDHPSIQVITSRGPPLGMVLQFHSSECFFWFRTDLCIDAIGIQAAL